MARTFKKDVYHAQLANTKTVLFTVGTGNQYNVRSISLCNINTTDEKVVLYYNNGTNDLILWSPYLSGSATVSETASFEYSEGSFTMSAGDTISGSTDTATKVTCTIMIEEEIG